MEKIKCYTVKMDSSTLIDTDLDNIMETIKIEIEENISDADPMSFDFGCVWLTQEEIDEMPEFDGF